MPRTRTWNPKLPEVPVDNDGNWLHYPTYEHTGWETIHQPFFDRMIMGGMVTGRSAKYLILKSTTTGKDYPMFISDLLAGIQKGLLSVESVEGEGYVSAHWTGSKRGANYGIKAVSV